MRSVDEVSGCIIFQHILGSAGISPWLCTLSIDVLKELMVVLTQSCRARSETL